MAGDLLTALRGLVSTWLDNAQSHANYAHHRSDPYDDVGHEHRVKADRLKKCADELSALLAQIEGPGDEIQPPSWTCKVRAAGAVDPPQDCDWPLCGCDEHADRVVAALQAKVRQMHGALPPSSAETGS